MVGNRDVNDNFVFEGIFPTCRKEYLKIEDKTSVLQYQLLNRCLNILKHSKLCGKQKECMEAKNYCKNLGVYLNHIQSTHQEEKKRRSCLFFFYKLKDMVKTYNGTCNTTEECYNIMRADPQILGSSFSTFFTEKISDTCRVYASNNNIDNNTFSKLQDLEKLYDIYEKFIEHNIDGCVHDSIIKEYKQIITKYVNENTSFKQELEKINRGYNSYKERNKHCQSTSIIVNQISVIDPMTSTERATEIASESTPVVDAAKDAWRYTATGVGIFTLVLLINMFILYKYTIFGSFLQSLLRKLRKKINKKNSFQKNLTDSFDRIYNHSNDINYRVAYISED